MFYLYIDFTSSHRFSAFSAYIILPLKQGFSCEAALTSTENVGEIVISVGNVRKIYNLIREVSMMKTKRIIRNKESSRPLKLSSLVERGGIDESDVGRRI